MNTSKIILSICILACTLQVQAQSKDSLEVIAASRKFIKAFVEFDWQTFRNSFSPTATVFFPAGNPLRRNGKNEIEQIWLYEFPEFTDTMKKFVLTIDPKDLQVQLYGSTAVVSFHLGEKAAYVSRRTFVFVKEMDEWKIVHLHASTISAEK